MSPLRLFGPPDVTKLKSKGDVKALIRATRDDRIKPQAIEALGELRDPQAVAHLITLLEDDPFAHSATMSLVQIGSLSIDPLINVLKLSDTAPGPRRQFYRMRTFAVQALGMIKDPRAIDSLIQCASSDYSRVVRYEAIMALGMIGDLQAIEFLEKVLRGNSHPATINPVEAEMTSHDDWNLHNAARRALTIIKEAKNIST